MHCPKCEDSELVAQTIDGVEVDHCPGCEGTWFDASELRALLDSGNPHVSELLEEGQDPERLNRLRARCPRDGQRLLAVLDARTHRTRLDLCRECGGVWLDGGEFRRLRETRPTLRLGDFL